MDTALQGLLSLEFVLFGLALAAITFVLRKFVEYFLDKPAVPANKTDKLWTELLLPIAPVINGGLLSWGFASYPYPEGFTSVGGRILFGIVAGLLSGLFYKVVKGMLKKKREENKPAQNTNSLTQ